MLKCCKFQSLNHRAQENPESCAEKTEVCITGRMGHIRLRKFIPFAAKTNWRMNTIQPACKELHQQQNIEEREECVVGPK